MSKRGLYLNHIDNYISKSMETGDTDFYHHFNHMTAEPLRVRDGVQLTQIALAMISLDEARKLAHMAGVI